MEYERLAHRLGKGKAKVAIARKMLVAIWHMWTKHEADKHASPEQVAAGYYAFAYKVGVANLGISARQFTSNRLKVIGLRDRVDSYKTSKKARKRVTLPPPD